MFVKTSTKLISDSEKKNRKLWYLICLMWLITWDMLKNISGLQRSQRNIILNINFTWQDQLLPKFHPIKENQRRELIKEYYIWSRNVTGTNLKVKLFFYSTKFYSGLRLFELINMRFYGYSFLHWPVMWYNTIWIVFSICTYTYSFVIHGWSFDAVNSVTLFLMT